MALTSLLFGKSSDTWVFPVSPSIISDSSCCFLLQLPSDTPLTCQLVKHISSETWRSSRRTRRGRTSPRNQFVTLIIERKHCLFVCALPPVAPVTGHGSGWSRSQLSTGEQQGPNWTTREDRKPEYLERPHRHKDRRHVEHLESDPADSPGGREMFPRDCQLLHDLQIVTISAAAGCLGNRRAVTDVFSNWTITLWNFEHLKNNNNNNHRMI